MEAGAPELDHIKAAMAAPAHWRSLWMKFASDSGKIGWA
jgi:hypothetical protein